MTQLKKNQRLKITILVDTPDSWIIPYVKKLQTKLKKRGHKIFFCNKPENIKEGDLAFFLGCGRIVGEKILKRSRNNLVVHASALPHGRGFAPLSWQILEGKNSIPIVLFEAVKNVDEGVIYFKDTLQFEGHELNDELRHQQGIKTIELVLKFVDAYPTVPGQTQKGKGTWYRRRTPKDSELDPDKTIAEQFDLLRTVDNKSYPAFFEYRDHTYVIEIRKAES